MKRKEVKEVLASQKDIQAAIEKLGTGQAIKYQLAETFGGDIAYVELNTTGKGGKYVLSFEGRKDFKIDGKPSGQKRVFITHSNAKFLGRWLNQRFADDKVPA